MRFAGDGGGWEPHDWGEVAALVHGAAARIVAERRERDAPVAIVLPNGPEFVATFFGALAVGNVACPLAPPNLLQNPDGYVDHVAALLRAADPALIATTPRYIELLSAGGSRSPEELAAIAGLDLTDPGFWNRGLELVRDQLDAAEEAAAAVSR